MSLDRGKITKVSGTQLTLREKTGDVVSTVVVPLSPSAIVTVDGVRATIYFAEAEDECADDADRRRPRRPHPCDDLSTLAPVAGTVLLVEDEPSVGELVRGYLTRDGYRVIWVRSGEEALVELDRHPVRLVLLDIGLPGKDGFDVCREMRQRSQVPILMLTARDEEPDRIVGLEVGADDYITKPFSPRELVARMKAVLRRSEPQERRDTYELADVQLDRESHDVTVAGKPVELTAKEFDLLAYFMANAGVLVSRDLLLDRVWGQEYPGGTRTVDVHVAQLRRKLGRPDLIRTLRGAGYKAVG